MMMGMVAAIGNPEARDSPAKFLIPASNLGISDAGSKVISSSGRIVPSSKTLNIFIPYSKGLMLSFFNRAASEALTFLPVVVTLKSLVI